MGNARSAALTALEKCRRMDAWSDAVLGSVMDAERLEGRDRSLTSALCYGVMQNSMLLDHIIQQISDIPMRKIEPKVQDILRLSIYQIHFMDRVPNAAAVNEAVKLCRKCGFSRASGFVNALLRKAADGRYTIPQGNDRTALSVRYSHPLWLTDLFLERLGTEETEQLLSAHNSLVPVTLQVNTRKTDSQTLLQYFAAEGKDAVMHPYLPDCILLSQGSGLTAMEPFRAGEFYIQDAAAKLSVIAAAPQAGQKILDTCAAPGGKSFAAAILSGGVEVTACDLHENKLKRIREGAQRLGLDQIAARAMDARAFQPEYEEAFDLVIADVPCSGLGVIRKKPDIRYKDPAPFAGLAEVQRAILENVCRYVAPGGTLLYSTCTVRKEENEDMAGAFLAGHPEFTAEEFSLPGGLESDGGMLQLWPQRNGTDGFFFAKMRKHT